MKNILRLSISIATLALALPSLRAEGSATPSAPAANEPLLVINLPANLKADDVTNAVAKSFNTHKWTGVATDKDTVTASHSQGGVSVTAKAVCSATEVKIFADYKGEGKNQEKAKSHVMRWLRYVEKNIKEELNLLPKPTKQEKKEESK